MADEARQRQRRSALRKFSRRKREERIAVGGLDPERDFVCPFCNGVYSLYYGRHKLHLQKCKHRIARTVQAPHKPPLPSPPPFENEIYPVPEGAGADDENMDEVHSETTSRPGLDDPPPNSIAEPSPIDVGPKITLQPGETLVVSHPHSRCPARIISTAELHGPHEPNILHNITSPQASYTPFPTRADFEQAEIFINNNVSNKLIDTQLKFERRYGMGLKVKSSREMHKLLAHGVEEEFTDDSKFRQEEISVPYIRGEYEEQRTYTVRYRPAMDAVLRTIKDPDLRGVFTTYPQRHYVHDPHGGNMRVWTDLHTADDWWSLQDKIGPEKVVIHVQLYSDATQLNRMGTKKWWGVYMFIGNIPQVPGRSTDTDAALADHRARVYHATLLKILESAVNAAGEDGFAFDDGRCQRLAQLIIAILSGDYEEYTRFASILGVQSEFKCPICLVPANALWDLCGTPYPKRSRNKTLSLIEKANKQTSATATKRALASQSIRGISNTFLDYFSLHMSLYEMFCSDPLHQIEQGVWGKHFWQWFKTHYIMKGELDELDANFMAIPPISRLHHFSNGVCRLKYITAREQGIILRYLSPLANQVCQLGQNQDVLIIPAIRHLACLLLLSRFHAHTTSTLSLLQGHINKFGELTKAIRSSPELFDHHEELSFSWPKMHSITHLVSCIQAKGAVLNYSSDSGEALHPQSHKDWGRTNQQLSAADQMLRMAFEREVIMDIRYRVNAYDEQCLFYKNVEPDINTVTHRSHVQLGSLDNIIHLSSYATKLRKDIHLQDLQKLLTEFLHLNRALNVKNSEIPGLQVVPCHVLRVTSAI
ncbi:hypothetical protein BJ322DRAFT_1109498 [Thelephora terrestris]|uniref:Uncharacterized protein n=1 Tax=Thelephora terrestris TaxID=56493 RepID=A0A9P6HDK6_9AGAM|nr:hypothetical protein BJ322DRAFT_1109498 [Thelephora terrestris]